MAALAAESAAATPADDGLDDKESELYDRQIRLWGVEAQKRIQNSKILMVGVGGLGAEVVKNLVLAGLSATIVDGATVSEADLASNFFLDAEDIGKNRAAAVLPRVQELNRLVTVECCAESLETMAADALLELVSKHNLIVCSNAPPALEKQLDALARERSIAFYAGAVFGYEGAFFVDLSTHTFREENGTGETATLTEPETIEYPSLDTALAVPWDALKHRRWGPVSPTFVRYRLLSLFHERTGRPATAADGAELFALGQETLATEGYTTAAEGTAFTEAMASHLAATAQAELAPVCAVMGGVLGQEIVKFVSSKGKPIENVYVFDAMACAGKTFRVPSESEKKRAPAPAPTAAMEVECL